MWPLYIGALIAVSTTVITWRAPWPFEAINRKFYDWKMTSTPATVISPAIVHVDVDDKATQSFGQWPWDRAVSAEIVNRLKALGAKTVVFDIMYASEGRSRTGNKALFDAIKQAGNIVTATGVAVSEEEVSELFIAEDAAERVEALFEAAWELNVPSRYRLPVVSRLRSSFVPLAPVIRNSMAVGHIKADQDSDGVHRRVPMLVKLEDKLIPGLSLATVYAAEGLSVSDIALTDEGTIQIVLPERVIQVPVDVYGRMLVRWAHPWESFPHYTVNDILSDDPDPSREQRYAGKIVIVGVSGTGATDFGVTPVSVYSPLSRIHSFAVNTILTESFIRSIPAFPGMAATALLTAIACAWCASVLRLRWAVVPPAILVVGALPLSVLLFRFASLELPTAELLFIVGPSAGAALVLRGMIKEREAVKTAKAIEQYLSPEILTAVIAGDGELDPGTKRKELTILVADIEGFTNISESVAPEYLSTYLNEYLELVTQAVYEHNGSVDKFLGDGVLAFFGDPSPLEDHALAAVQAARRMLGDMIELNAKWADSGIPQLKDGLNMRIAINTGPVVVGNFGSSRRMEYTAVGAAVNIANQLKYRAPSGGILLTSRTRALVKDRVSCSDPESVRIKGLDHDVQVCRVGG